jgi:putative salt-induced outer membrane protein YdiY
MRKIALSLSVVALSGGAVWAQDEQPDEAVEAAQQAAAEQAWYDEWDGGVDIGLDGSSGNTDRTNLRIGANATREANQMITKARLLYLWSEEDSNETENRFLASLRNDWLLGDSPWRIFAEVTWELDEFKDYDHRLSGVVGGGYEFIQDDKVTLLGLFGVGARKDFGAEDDDVKPEALLGLEFDYQIKEDHKFAAATYFYPNLDDTSEYRWNSLAAYEIILDERSNLYLKLGVENQYDSDPGPDTEENDFYYFVSLGWAF